MHLCSDSTLGGPPETRAQATAVPQDASVLVGDIEPCRTRLVLLGTAAGPFPAASRQGCSSLLDVGGRGYLVDAGYGALRKYIQSGVHLRDLRAVFVTHLHSDHVADLFTLFLLGWGKQNSGIDQPVKVHGPGALTGDVVGSHTTGTRGLIASCLQAFSYDLDVRSRTSPRTPLGSLIDAVDLAGGTPGSTPVPFAVYEDDRVQVSAVRVPHPPVFPAFAYRFETEDATVVFSGDTARSDDLAALAEGADILVHEAMQPTFYRRRGYRPELVDFLTQSHTSPTEVGKLAKDAGVRTVVLNHLGPPDPREMSDDDWESAVGAHFHGRIVVGHDLQQVCPAVRSPFTSRR